MPQTKLKRKTLIKNVPDVHETISGEFTLSEISQGTDDKSKVIVEDLKSNYIKLTMSSVKLPIDQSRPSTTYPTEKKESDTSLNEDIVALTVSEISQKIVNCLVGRDLFVDKTWCMVKKVDILEDINLQEANSPFMKLMPKIQVYPLNELLIGYEPFAATQDQFMLCITEAGRDQVLEQLENMEQTFTHRMQQSKELEPRKWTSQGSEEFVDQFQLKPTRKPITMEWVSDLTKRKFNVDKFGECDPDDMKNGYTCLVPSERDQFDLIFKKTQESGVQAVVKKVQSSVQTEPEIPTNACTQYAPETEIFLHPIDTAHDAVTSKDLNNFFNKYLNYLLESLTYNEEYDLYYDDYPALLVSEEEAQLQSLGTYLQYQSFTDVISVKNKQVISTSWHPNYTGIVAVAYANEIPSLMKDLEFDSDQTDYEEKTDDEAEPRKEEMLGVGAKEWLEDKQKEQESTSENTEDYDRAVKKRKEIEPTKAMVWDVKSYEETENISRSPEDIEGDDQVMLHQYEQYREPEPKSKPEIENEGGSTGVPEDVEVNKKLEQDSMEEVEVKQNIESTSMEDLIKQIESDEFSYEFFKTSITQLPADELSTTSVHLPSMRSSHISRKQAHHKKKYRRSIMEKPRFSFDSAGVASTNMDVSSSHTIPSLIKEEKPKGHMTYEKEYIEEISDTEDIKGKQEELPLFELNNPVLIWSLIDDLKPKLKLDSPYEVQMIAFCKHDGNLIAGGTASGQVIVWDITGCIEALEKPKRLTLDQQKCRKRMEKLLSWSQNTQNKTRVSITAISKYSESHTEKVTNLIWLSPTVMVTEKMDIIKKPSSQGLAFLTTCMQGEVRVWDLKSKPLKVDQKNQLELFKKRDRFGRPNSLDPVTSPYKTLYQRWKPFTRFQVLYKNKPILLTGLHIPSVEVSYERVTQQLHNHREMLEDRIEYRPVFGDTRPPKYMYLSDLFGTAGIIDWEPTETDLPQGEILPHTVRMWEQYHDGPITQLRRHPIILSICLSIGGHVFSVWHMDNLDEPIFTKRHFGARVTAGAWSALRPSLISIARSDGIVEIWDLLFQSHAPATTIIVSGRVITHISYPILPENQGLIGVADYNSAFRLFFIPQQFKVYTEQEFERFKRFINREPERKRLMKEWSIWWKEHNVNIDREEKKQADVQKKKIEEVRIEKEKQEDEKKKYNAEVYKWYIRRHGKPFLREEEANEKWREKQEEHMLEMIMAKKKLDMHEAELLMKPLLKEEKNEARKHAKAQERLKQSDEIFHQAVGLIFPHTKEVTSKDTNIDTELRGKCVKLVDYNYGEHFKSQAQEEQDIVDWNPWQFEIELYDLQEKNDNLRIVFNDPRRKRSKTLRWYRKKLREELMKEGQKIHVRQSHAERYQKRKLKRRQENLDWLKKVYGENYSVNWDKRYPCRRFSDRKHSYALSEMDSQQPEEVSEPEMEDEGQAEMLPEGKVQSTLELLSEMGIENVPEQLFAADVDTALLTIESRVSLGVKRVPSLKFDKGKSRKISTSGNKSVRSFSHLTVPSGYDSPQDDSDVSVVVDPEYVAISRVVDENIMEKMDYIKHPIRFDEGKVEKKGVKSERRQIKADNTTEDYNTVSDISEEETSEFVTDYAESHHDTSQLGLVDEHLHIDVGQHSESELE